MEKKKFRPEKKKKERCQKKKPGRKGTRGRKTRGGPQFESVVVKVMRRVNFTKKPGGEGSKGKTSQVPPPNMGGKGAKEGFNTRERKEDLGSRNGAKGVGRGKSERNWY